MKIQKELCNPSGFNEKSLMAKKPTYEDLEQKVKELEKETVGHKRAKEELQTILNAVPVIIFQKDRDGKTILTNQAFDNMIRLSKEEIIGKTTDELFPEHGKDMMKDDQEVMELGKPKKFSIVFVCCNKIR